MERMADIGRLLNKMLLVMQKIRILFKTTVQQIPTGALKEEERQLTPVELRVVLKTRQVGHHLTQQQRDKMGTQQIVKGWFLRQAAVQQW